MAIQTSIRSTIADFFMRCEKNGIKVYFDKVSEMAIDGKQSVVIDFQDIQAFDVDLAVSLITDPKRTLDAFRAEVMDMLGNQSPEYQKSLLNKTVVRINNMSDITPIRSVNVSTLGRLFAVAGAVIRVSERKNLVKIAVFVCHDGHVTPVIQNGETLKAPDHCDEPVCSSKDFEFDKERSIFADYQKVRIQEMNDDLPSGQLPRGFDIILTDDMIDTCRPGDHVIVTGTLIPIQDRIVGSAKSRVFTSEIDCNYAEIRDKNVESSRITKQDVLDIKAIAERPAAYQDLIMSIAPAILGYEQVKESILLQLAGGVPMTFEDGTKRRGDLHLMIVGEPGVAKSELLQFAQKAAIRGMSASGKGSTSAGLSAGIVKERDTMYLEAGVMPLSDLGLACIDELDKMSKEDRSAMHEMMEQQRFTLNKAGFHMTLNTRTSVLAALNPQAGVYDSTISFMENIKLPPPLVSRFDLITIILDRPSAANDAAIAQHILSEHIKGGYATAPPIPLALLKRYIAYARLNVKPDFTQEAGAILGEYYAKLRRQSEPGKVPITARTLESLIRIATARAKILLRERVTADDALVAINLMERMFKEVFTDMKTGEINTEALAGISKKDGQQKSATQALAALGMGAKGGLIEKAALITEMRGRGLDEETSEKMVKWLLYEGRVMEPSRGMLKILNPY